MTYTYILITFLVALVVLLSYIVYNLLSKVEKYEDATADQARYLQRISNTIGESKLYLQKLDEKGTFQGEDEVGAFFGSMQAVQEELNKYMLPENYGKEES
tara:strand:+ start:2043 stop:2345 length:303 start_codon:yes stop_codon:yes gene_type:complete